MPKTKLLKIECQKNIITNKKTKEKIESYIMFPTNEFNTLIVDNECKLILEDSYSNKSILDEFLECDDYEDFFTNYGFLFNIDSINSTDNEEKKNVFEINKKDVDIIKKRLICTKIILNYRFKTFNTDVSSYDATNALFQLLNHNNNIRIDDFNYCSSPFLIKDSQTAFIFKEKNKDSMSDKLRIAYTEKIDKLTEEQKLCIEYLYQICLEQPYIRYNIFTGDPEIFKEEKDDYFEYSLHHLQIEDQVMDIIIYHEIEHHIKDSRLSMSLNDNFSTKIEFNNLIGIMYYTILKQAMFKPKKKKCANPDCDNLIDLRKVNYNTKYCSERCKNLINQRKYQARKKNK